MAQAKLVAVLQHLLEERPLELLPHVLVLLLALLQWDAHTREPLVELITTTLLVEAEARRNVRRVLQRLVYRPMPHQREAELLHRVEAQARLDVLLDRDARPAVLPRDLPGLVAAVLIERPYLRL